MVQGFVGERFWVNAVGRPELERRDSLVAIPITNPRVAREVKAIVGVSPAAGQGAASVLTTDLRKFRPSISVYWLGPRMWAAAALARVAPAPLQRERKGWS